MRQSSRTAFIQIAGNLFSKHGFDSIGLDQVILEVGVSKTTFYKHFESKDELILAVLATRHEEEFEALQSKVAQRAGDDPQGRILAIFDVFDDWFAEPDFRTCMFLGAATEFPLESDPIHQAAIHHGSELARFVREQAVHAGADTEQAAAIATQIALLLTGAIVTRQVAKSPNAAKVAKATAEVLLDRLLPRQPTRANLSPSDARARTPR